MRTWVPRESDRATGDASPGVDSPRRPLDAWKGHLGRTRRTNGLPPVLADLNLLGFFLIGLFRSGLLLTLPDLFYISWRRGTSVLLAKMK